MYGIGPLAPGAVGAVDGRLTVRETGEDRKRIADVDQALRRLFRFGGCRWLEGILVHGTAGDQAFQQFESEDLGPRDRGDESECPGRDSGRIRPTGGCIHTGPRTVLGTTVRVCAGQTAVLGRTPPAVESRDLITIANPQLVETIDDGSL